MKVRDAMMGSPVSCTSGTNLGAAVEMLWERNCGILPIVDTDSKVVGVITDRDLCVALGTRNRLAGQVTVGEVASGEVHSCRAADDIHTALQTMADHRVRRLPVVNDEGVLEGILSMDNVVLHAESASSGRGADLSNDDVVKTLRQIYAPRVPQVVEARAARA